MTRICPLVIHTAVLLMVSIVGFAQANNDKEECKTGGAQYSAVRLRNAGLLYE